MAKKATMTAKSRMDIRTYMSLPEGRPGKKCKICGNECESKAFYPMSNGKLIGVAICSYDCKEQYKKINI